MGLFGKKPRICSVCNSKLGLLDLMAIELTDGYLCGKCQKNCSPFLEFDYVNEKWASDDVKNHFADLERQKNQFTKEYKETDCIVNSKSGEHPGQKLLSLDKNHGWFNVYGGQEIFELSQINKLVVEYSTCDDGEDLHFAFQPPRPGMKAPGRGETVSVFSVVILMKDHPYAKRIEIPISTTGRHMTDHYQNYLKNIYNTAAEIYDILAPYVKS